MKIFFLLALMVGWTTSAPAQVSIINWHLDKIYVIDGDTYKINDKKYRLCGINTPEKGKYYYQEAGAALKFLLQRGDDIKITVVGVGTYGREIVVMQSNNYTKSINEILVEGGYARHFARFSRNCAPHIKVSALRKWEDFARRNAKGIWSKSKN